MRQFAVLCAVAVGLTTVAHAQIWSVHYTEVSGPAGILPFSMAYGLGGGLAAADFDDDGDVDMFAPTAIGVPHQLYRNLGNGQFEEIAAAAGLASPDNDRTAVWLDYDGDHRLDLLVAGDCYQLVSSCLADPTLKLYRQVANAQFVDVTEAAGILGDDITDLLAHRGGVAAGDINNDGYLDIITGVWAGDARLYLNNGNGTFTDISSSSGVGVPDDYWQPVMHDFNEDGLTDIFFAVDFDPNYLWINQGDHTFTDMAEAAGVDTLYNEMGVALSDYDNDGDIDIYSTNIFVSGKHNVLFRNDTVAGVPQFAEVSLQAKVHDTAWGWGTTFLDANLDTLPDLAATNGFRSDDHATDVSRFFRNLGGSPVTFQIVSTPTGFNDTRWGSALVAFDRDRDGDLDLAQSCNDTDFSTSGLRLLDNDGTPGSSRHYLTVRPRMTGANYSAIGAVVRVEIGSLDMTRVITAGTSFFGQEPAEAHFGLGSATVVDRVTIDWPGGMHTEQLSVAADQLLTVTVETDTDLDQTADLTDPDDDNDGVPDAQDCFRTNQETWAVPGEATGLRLARAAGVTLVDWDPPVGPGGTRTLYDVVASSDPSDFVAGATCAATNHGPGTATAYSADPAPGEIVYLVVRGENSCGVGPAGSDSSGTPHVVRSCL